MGELRLAVLQNRATIDYLLLKYNIGCLKFIEMCAVSISLISLMLLTTKLIIYIKE